VADRHLLHADEEQIDRASIAIADGTAFIVALCPPEARPAALTYLGTHVKHLAFPESVEMGTADEMFAALSEQVEQKNRVLSLTLGRDVLGSFDALNLHREKVLKGGPVILWLDDVATLRTMRERAPDAYSYRTTMMVIRGDGGALAGPSKEESEHIATLRKRLKRARTPLARADEALDLAGALRASGRVEEAAESAHYGLLGITNPREDSDFMARALLCRELSTIHHNRRQRAQSLHWARRASVEVEPVSLTKSLRARAAIWGTWPGPYNTRDRRMIGEALSLVHRFGLPMRDHYQVLLATADIALAQGNIPKLRSLAAQEREHRSLEPMANYWALVLDADLFLRKGALLDAERSYRIAADYALANALSVGMANSRVVHCMVLRGELDAADRLMPRLFTLLARGAVDDALLLQNNWMAVAIEGQIDGDIFDVTARIAEIALSAHHAQRLSLQQIESILSDLELAHDVIMELSGPDGPEWYPIQLRSRRAEVLRIAGKPAEALDLLRQTLDLARKTYPDLIPETGRALVDHLLYAHQFDEALVLIDEIEPIALEKEFLEERARLVADRILALVGKNTAAEEIAPHVHELRSALAATDSKRITAETLRHLAERLPTTTTFPDPISLADEAHRLFVAMPIPAEEAMCLEIMGDVLASRGQIEEAKMRYANARGRLERHGLLLRVPLIEEKLSRS
jgi:tetratricopeptide (TPR) repeat protein